MASFRRSWRNGFRCPSHWRPQLKSWRGDAEFPSYWHRNAKQYTLENPLESKNARVSARLPHFSSYLRVPILRSLLHRAHRPQKSDSRTLMHSLTSNSFPGNKKQSSSITFGRTQSVDKRAPKGCVALYIGEEQERFIIPIPYLYHPALLELLKEAEHEFGFRQNAGLTIPCPVFEFQQKLSLIETKKDRRLIVDDAQPGKLAWSRKLKSSSCRK